MDSQPARKPAGRPGFFTKKPALWRDGPALSKARRPGLNLSKPARPGPFRTLLYSRFKRTGEFEDLQQAILRAEEAVAATAQDHLYQASRLGNIGIMLRSRFERTGDLEDIQQAILRVEAAVA
jgi:hypothetical protein